MEVQPEQCISISFEPTSKKNIDLRKKHLRNALTWWL